MKKVDQWYQILLFSRETPKNQAAMVEYFFEQFAQNPEDFLLFLNTIKKTITNKNRSGSEKTLLARRYLAVISSLCERFGYYEFKMQLDDQCFSLTNKKEFTQIEKRLAVYQKKSRKLLKFIEKKIQEALSVHSLNATIKGRYKNIYSIYQKLQKKRYPSLDRIHDIFAFRIITEGNDESQCFNILGALHDQFHPITSRFKDYITIPKINGYRSLHTGLTEVVPEVSTPIEVQIRTPEMDEFAERGLAAHFLYTPKKKSSLLSEKEKKLIKHFSILGRQVAHEQKVNCFSSKGDLFCFRKGANLLDFAHRIHTGLAAKASSALVNGKSKNLYTKIEEGDMIHIQTHQDIPPLVDL